MTLRRTLTVSAFLFAIMLLAAGISLSVGAVAIPLRDLWSLFTGGEIGEQHRTILLDIRLPRVLLAIIVGGGLSIAGAVFQALLRNPLAEPYILGVSSGGALGAVLAISFGFAIGVVSVPLASFFGSLLVMFSVYGIATRYGRIEPTTLLLAGVMVGAFLNAMILLVASVFHREVRNAFLWLMGNLASANFPSLVVVGPVILACVIVLYSQSRHYNLIATGEETALQLGVNVETVKRVSYVLASLITGSAVSVSGIIGFVGLIVPHICRMVLGPDHRLLLPAAFFIGATFLLFVDMLSRTLIAPAEIPVGAMTAMFGAPVFVWLLRRKG